MLYLSYLLLSNKDSVRQTFEDKEIRWEWRWTMSDKLFSDGQLIVALNVS